MTSTSPTDRPETPTMNIMPSSVLLWTLYATFSKHGPSDLTVRTSDGREFHVHKSVVCKKSKFFHNAVNGPFKEAASGIIDMPNDPPTAIAATLLFLYKDNYVVDGLPFSQHWRFHVDAYIAGSIYNLSSLKYYAKRQFTGSIFRMGPPGYAAIPKAISILYDSTPDTDRILRDWLEDFSFRQLGRLLMEPEFLEIMATFDSFRDAIVEATKAERARVQRLDDHVVDLQRCLNIRESDRSPVTMDYYCPDEACRYKMMIDERHQLDSIYCFGCKKVSDQIDWNWRLPNDQ